MLKEVYALKKIWKKIIPWVLLVCMLSGLTACKGSSENKQNDSTKPKENIKLTFWVANSVSADEQKQSQDTWYITKCIERFEKANPGTSIEITLQVDGMQVFQNFKASVVAGNGPDIVDFFAGPTLLSVKDGLIPLNDYISKEERENIIGWEAVSENMDPTKKIYAYPYPGQSWVGISYNKSLIKKAGLDFDANPPRSMEEFDAALEAIKTAGILPFNSDESWPLMLYYIMNFWWSQKTGLPGILAHNNKETKYADDSGFLDMLSKYQSYYKKGYIN